MKYHEKNEDGRFIVSLVIASILALLVIAVPAANFPNLLHFF